MSYIVPPYQLKPGPGEPWGQKNHPWPGPETDRIDAIFNLHRETTIILNPEQMAFAAAVAHALRKRARQRKTYNDAPTTMAHDASGHQCEYAYCLWKGIVWRADINGFHNPDCGKITQVRSTHRQSGCLIFRTTRLPGQQRRDNPDHHFVLVVHTLPRTFRIVGWLPGRDCVNPAWVKSYNGRDPEYFVPQEFLLTDFTHCDDPDFRLEKKLQKGVDSEPEWF